MTALTAPPSLRDFLDGGGVLAAVDGLNLRLLADLVDIPNPTPDRVAMWTQYFRETVDAWIHGEPSEMDQITLRNSFEHTQGDVCRYAWAADALESPALLAMVRWLP
jgi:hypothetical protein